jgi:hypothetical protein
MSNRATRCANHPGSASRFIARRHLDDPKINRLQKMRGSDQTAVGTPPFELPFHDLAKAETGMASQLASAWPRKLAAPAGGFDQGLDGLWISRTISSRSNFSASRHNRVALESQLCLDQKIHEYHPLVIIGRGDSCPWGARVSTTPAVAVAPGADHLNSHQDHA